MTTPERLQDLSFRVVEMEVMFKELQRIILEEKELDVRLKLSRRAIEIMDDISAMINKLHIMISAETGN